jgi:hypothetical protein
MKNMLKNKTSLIIVCVFIGILICYFTMCNCRMNYSLIEGLATTMPPPGSTAPTTTSPLKAPMAKAASMGVPAAAAPTPAPSTSNTTAVGAKSKGPATASKPTTTTTTTTTPTTVPPAPVKDSFQARREGFQQQRPIDYGSLQESKSDEWNLSKWVKDAMRYAKGMGNENRLDSYQYNTGPPIPLPEGELFFFKDTKFSPDCCPGTYSSSLGCACLSKPQFNYLVTRGGNNTVPAGRKSAYYNEY